MTKTPLGKGLESLIPAKKTKLEQFKETVKEPFTQSPQIKKDSVFYIEASKIKPNPDQPRKNIDLEDLKELSQSIREHGILQPLVVTKLERETPRGVEVEYVLIAGERRLEAAKLAKLREVPVIVKNVSNRNRLELSLVENIQRANLNAIDRAHAFKRLEKDFGLRHSDIAEKIGKSRETITNTLRLLDLPPEMQKAIEIQKISEGHARSLLAINTPEQREAFFQEMLKRQMSVREAEFIARTHREKDKPRVELVSWGKWEKRFEKHLNRAVKIRARKGGGEVIIPFADEKELTVLHDLFSSVLD